MNSAFPEIMNIDNQTTTISARSVSLFANKKCQIFPSHYSCYRYLEIVMHMTSVK